MGKNDWILWGILLLGVGYIFFTGPGKGLADSFTQKTGVYVTNEPPGKVGLI